MKPGNEWKPTIPGYYLRNGLWWTRVTPVHEYLTATGEKRMAYAIGSNADPDKATRYETLGAAFEAKHYAEKPVYTTPYDVIEVLPDGSMVNHTLPSPPLPTDVGAKVLGELMESYGNRDS